MSRISESMIGDEFSDPLEFMDQPGRKVNRKSSLVDVYDDDDDEDDDYDEDDDDDEEFEEEDEDE